MPELPEVETMVRGIRPSVEGRTLLGIRRCPCRKKPILIEPAVRVMSRRVSGRRITTVRRIAKRVVLELDSGDAFVVEPRMTGLMLLADPPSAEHLRFEWEFAPRRPEEASRLWFWDRRGLGTLRLYSPGELQSRLSLPYLGTDALAMSLSEWRDMAGDTSREIKVVLLDQKRVAGIGNLYASEILHQAGIHPETPANRIGARRIARLHAAVLSVLETAIRYEGSTLNDGTYRNALNQDGNYQNEHRVYAREGLRCPTCAQATILRIVQAQRATFFCPRCQRKASTGPPAN